MTANINPKTGIRYGVLHGNNVPEVLDDIMRAGEDETFLAIRKDIKERLQSAVENVIDIYTWRAEELAKELDYERILETLEDRGLWDGFEADEHEYTMNWEIAAGEVSVLVGWLGGALLIWVLESPYVANCRPCSPCVPNAGDLDSPDEDGVEAYCLPKEDMPKDWKGTVRLLEVQK